MLKSLTDHVAALDRAALDPLVAETADWLVAAGYTRKASTVNTVCERTETLRGLMAEAGRNILRHYPEGISPNALRQAALHLSRVPSAVLLGTDRERALRHVETVMLQAIEETGHEIAELILSPTPSSGKTPEFAVGGSYFRDGVEARVTGRDGDRVGLVFFGNGRELPVEMDLALAGSLLGEWSR